MDIFTTDYLRHTAEIRPVARGVRGGSDEPPL